MEDQKFRFQRRSRKKQVAGDIVGMQSGHGWFFGRVVNTDVCADIYGAWSGCILFYVFAYLRTQPVPPSDLSTSRLLLPPLIINREGWLDGQLVTLENRPLLGNEVLRQHCFEAGLFHVPKYYDEYVHQLPYMTEPCGSKCLTHVQGIENRIDDAMRTGREFIRDL